MKVLKFLLVCVCVISIVVLIPFLSSSNAASSGIISVEFDDGWKVAYKNAIPILNKYNIKTTQAIISNANIGNLSYISDNEIRNLSNQGHQISSHTVTHRSLPSLNDAQLRIELLNSRNKLQEIIGKRVTYFVAPYCEFGSREIDAAKDYYKVARNCFTENENTRNGVNIYNLDSKVIEKSTSLQTFKNWIDTAKCNNSLLILVYHKVGPSTNDTYSVTPQVFDNQMSIVSKSGLKIQTTLNALKTMGKI